MRIGYRKKIGGVYISGGTSTKGLGKGILSLFLLPFYLMYYVCIWPFIALYRLLSKNKKSLKSDAAMMAPQYLRIINDCSRIISETKNPETFFNRYDLLLETLSKFAEIEQYAPFKGEKPSAELYRLSSQREKDTDDFIDRYAQDTRMKIYELSSQKGKANKAEAFKNIMSEFSDRMTEENKYHVMLAYEDMKINAVNT